MLQMVVYVCDHLFFTAGRLTYGRPSELIRITQSTEKTDQVGRDLKIPPVVIPLGIAHLLKQPADRMFSKLGEAVDIVLSERAPGEGGEQSELGVKTFDEGCRKIDIEAEEDVAQQALQAMKAIPGTIRARLLF